MTHVIVLGNEKGGSGKSTAAMHVIVALLKSGSKVAAIDLDMRQRSLSRYLQNRRKYSEIKGMTLDFPALPEVSSSDLDSREAARQAETKSLKAVLMGLGDFDYVIIDCPGADSHLSRLAHDHADTIITPLNDSFVDFDLLAELAPETGDVVKPSIYSEMVWNARKRRALSGAPGGIDWVVMRNRVSATRSNNKARMGKKLEDLSARIGFRLARGLGDRVIYRELFSLGLTLLDLGGKDAPVRLSTMSHVTARLEIRSLIATLKLPERAGAKAAQQFDQPVANNKANRDGAGNHAANGDEAASSARAGREAHSAVNDGGNPAQKAPAHKTAAQSEPSRDADAGCEAASSTERRFATSALSRMPSPQRIGGKGGEAA
ncbi:MAG: division plane positioning ATPase MipZ [Pseudomonadota bacterium]